MARLRLKLSASSEIGKTSTSDPSITKKLLPKILTITFIILEPICLVVLVKSEACLRCFDEAGLLRKRSCLAEALGVTEVMARILVTFCSAA